MVKEERRMNDWICKEVQTDNGGYFEPVEELIRCKECKHQRIEYREDKRRKDGGYYVYWCDNVDGYSPLGFDNQYCSEAERKEE